MSKYPGTLTGLVNRVAAFEFTFDEYTIKGEWFKWRTTSPRYQRSKAEKIAALPTIPKDASEADAEKMLADIEKEIRRINAEVMKDTIKSWDAVEILPRTLTAEEYDGASARLQAFYKRESDDENAGYVIVNEADAETERPVPLTVEVFEELPTLFSRMLGEHFQKLREEVLNPTKPDSSQSG